MTITIQQSRFVIQNADGSLAEKWTSPPVPRPIPFLRSAPLEWGVLLELQNLAATPFSAA
jgi:hypothetical protein